MALDAYVYAITVAHICCHIMYLKTFEETSYNTSSVMICTIYWNEAWTPAIFVWRCDLTSTEIPIMKIRQPHDSLIFIVWMHIPERQFLYRNMVKDSCICVCNFSSFCPSEIITCLRSWSTLIQGACCQKVPSYDWNQCRLLAHWSYVFFFIKSSMYLTQYCIFHLQVRENPCSGACRQGIILVGVDTVPLANTVFYWLATHKLSPSGYELP